MAKVKSLIGSLMTLIFLMPSTAYSDRRNYVWTYEFKTTGKGEAEIENYTTFTSPDISNLRNTTSTEHQVELEVGMTDRFDFSIYQVFTQNPGTGIAFYGYKLRFRYKLAEENKLLLNPLLYLEYIGKSNFSKHGIEFKLILDRNIQRLNIAFNPLVEFERESEWEYKAGYSLGISYELGKLLRLGVEARGDNNGNYFGPVLSHGREDLWVTIGSAFRIGETSQDKPEFLLRLLIGIGLPSKRPSKNTNYRYY